MQAMGWRRPKFKHAGDRACKQRSV